MRRTQVRRRLALLRRAAEIGPTDAFFAAAERKDLPFPLTESKPDIPASDGVPAGLVPLLREAVATDDPHAIAGNKAALQELIDAWEKVVTDPSFDQSSGRLRVGARNHLATARSYLFDLMPQAEDLERIIELLRDALNAAGGGDYDTPGLLNNLGNTYERRYRLIGDAAYKLWGSARSHAHSLHWAAFAYTGV